MPLPRGLRERNAMNNKFSVFFDTNILLYAHVCQDAKKQDAARRLINESIQHCDCSISTQVVQEFCNNMMKKAGATEMQVSTILHKIEGSFKIAPIQMPIIEKALDIKGRYGFSFWDSLIVASALSLQCKVRYTEDLQNEQLIDGAIRVVNPFIQ